MPIGKPRLALDVELALKQGDIYCELFGGAEIGPLEVLRNARLVKLSDEDKPNYLVIKFSYIIRDPLTGKIALFSRSAAEHSAIVARHSALLSSGLDSELAAIQIGGTLATNPAYPITKKLGGLVGSLDMPSVSYKQLGYPVRFSAFAARRRKDRFYLFIIHVAHTIPGAPFPSDSFNLLDARGRQRPNGDQFKGFFPIETAREILSREDSGLLVDDLVLRMLANDPPSEMPEGLQFSVLSPSDSKSSWSSTFWNSLKLEPSFMGMGINLKTLFKR